uniref:Uncharacterized protein n=1 Tax=Tremella fuciformis TaxID=64657 RepID=D5KXZ7_9TREE|nr:unknown [Tremella fuciformis]
MSPQLVYHHLAAPLYPTNSQDSLLAIRFAQPTQLASIRVIPDGVKSLAGVGQTSPARWNGRLYLNVSDAVPVNALQEAELDYEQAGWEQDYPIVMPSGITTRLLLFRSPATKLSLSVYAVATPSATAPAPLISQTQDSICPAVEDLLGLLSDGSSQHTISNALELLDVLADTTPVLEKLLDHPVAMSWLLLQPSYPPIPLMKRLLSDRRSALHPNLRHHLLPSHPLRHLVAGDTESRRTAAWTQLDNGGLHVLKDIGIGDPWQAVDDRSRLSLLLGCTEGWLYRDGQDSLDKAEQALDILDGISDASAVRYLAKALPRLVVYTRCRGSTRTLNLAQEHARTVLSALLRVASSTFAGRSCFPQAAALAEAFYLGMSISDPLRSLWTAPHSSGGPSSTLEQDHNCYERLSRFVKDPSASAVCLEATPSELLSIVAPGLLASLRSSREPPLGIVPLSSSFGGGETQASAWAGKVYSSHEFRNREGVAVASGLSRPASRHVDAYT